MQHNVDSVTDMTLCVFPRADLWDMFRDDPARAHDITWLAAREEHFLGDMLAIVGRRAGVERVSWGLLVLYRRALARELARDDVTPMPFRQRDLADAFGLSLVHTNKALGHLRWKGLILLGGGELRPPDVPALEDLANMEPETESPRPLI